MSQAARHPAYLLIEDRLDAIGQKYRVQRLMRGAMLFGCGAVVASILAALVAHFTGAGGVARLVLWLWIVWMIASALWWMVCPLLLRPGALEVARLVETRIDELNNGLTNSVLLAQAHDLQDNPWLPEIFEEVLVTTRQRRLEQAVKLSDLRGLGMRLLYVLVPVLLLAMLMPGRVAQGWKQMFRPTAFVPQTGEMTILEVRPGDVTLVTGQPLEVSVLAEGPGAPTGKLIFDNGSLEPAELIAHSVDGQQLRYAYRVEHVDEPMRYRVEVGSTQSPWYAVTLVRQVKLTELILKVTPPAYTGQPPETIVLKDDAIGQSPITVLQGSHVELAATLDVPVGGALMQLGKNAPQELTAEGTRRFVGSFHVLEETSLSLLLTAGGEQIIAALPDPPLKIYCTLDAAPRIEMRWPTQDVAVDPQAPIVVSALLRDDHGLSGARVLMGPAGAPMSVAVERTLESARSVEEFSHELQVPSELRRHGESIFVQVEATDNRSLVALMKDGGRQTVSSQRYEIRFRDALQIAQEQKEKADRLRRELLEMLQMQRELHDRTVAWNAGQIEAMQKIGQGQAQLRDRMRRTADTFEFDAGTKIVQKTLLVLVYNPAGEAVELAGQIVVEPNASEQVKLSAELQSRQRRIIMALENLLAMLNAAPDPTTMPTSREGGDLENPADVFRQLKEDLKKFIDEEQRILDQTAPLAKKPVDNWDEQDKKLLEELLAAQEKLDAFMQAKVHDFSKLAEQDMANATLLQELIEVYSEVTMARDALREQAIEIAVAAEEMGVELAGELSANLEKWLTDKPDRIKWMQEDPLETLDVPMAELPAELEDMIGELMEEQEDLFDEIEDMNANWADSLDKGAGWDAMDGPIANMSARGVTGNVLPNQNEMGGRSGEGRSGRSVGEMVEDTATGKGGRNTPTRLDPTPFSQGQIKDESQDPVGGATGGGKLSGQGGAGLEGPVAPQQRDEYLQRLASRQAELRNSAERLNLQYQLGRYDNFKLLESIALMRRVESDLQANRYANALRRRDVLLDRLDTSHLLLSGQIHVQRDTSPTMSKKLEDEINDAMRGHLPAAWSEALKEYYRKLATE